MIGPFTGQHAYLSNFWYAPFVFCSVTYPTVEHFYQSAKADNARGWLAVIGAPTPRDAKRVGRSIRMNSEFESAKKVIMMNGVISKFRQHPELSGLLAGTGNEYLCEVNTWGDRYWGFDGNGENWLGRILMMVRELVR